MSSIITYIAEPPSHLCCPITNELFHDPVFEPKDGTTYERTSIIEKYPQIDLKKNNAKRQEADMWFSKHAEVNRSVIENNVMVLQKREIPYAIELGFSFKEILKKATPKTLPTAIHHIIPQCINPTILGQYFYYTNKNFPFYQRVNTPITIDNPTSWKDYTVAFVSSQIEHSEIAVQMFECALSENAEERDKCCTFIIHQFAALPINTVRRIATRVFESHIAYKPVFFNNDTFGLFGMFVSREATHTLYNMGAKDWQKPLMRWISSNGFASDLEHLVCYTQTEDTTVCDFIRRWYSCALVNSNGFFVSHSLNLLKPVHDIVQLYARDTAYCILDKGVVPNINSNGEAVIRDLIPMFEKLYMSMDEFPSDPEVCAILVKYSNNSTFIRLMARQYVYLSNYGHPFTKECNREKEVEDALKRNSFQLGKVPDIVRTSNSPASRMLRCASMCGMNIEQLISDIIDDDEGED